jgi:hypothetical protein
MTDQSINLGGYKAATWEPELSVVISDVLQIVTTIVANLMAD